ncbi:MAG: CRTAC1 family protein [Pyrinomonadaceae bacterium]
MKYLLVPLLLFCLQAEGLAQKVPASTPAPTPAPIFTDIANESGLDFSHYNGMTGKLLLPEIMGSGAALFDFDGDGDLDAYLVQETMLERNKGLADSIFPWNQKERPSGRLFRNDLEIGADGKATVKFTDVTKKSGIRAEDYGFGVAVGDIDNDGDWDLYLTNLHGNKLYLNNGDGTFADITEKSKTDDNRWSISATFFDYDRDGFQDLFLVNYGVFDLDKLPKCYARTTAPDYCGPKSYQAVGNSLFRNRGDGTFENTTDSSGLAKEFGHGLGVVAADFNDDGWPDLYVANDGDANQLWINQKDGTFKNEGLFSGTAVNHLGVPEASMGVDAGDYNSDGRLDIFITHLMDETHTIYANQGDAIFEDLTPKTDLALPDQRLTGFGTSFIDYDNDCLLDVFVANGSVKLLKAISRPGNAGELDPKYPLGQRNQLFRNTGKGQFIDVSEMAGASFQNLAVSRGAAFGDIDNDGDMDILVNNNSGTAELLLNNQAFGNDWIGLSLSQKKGGIQEIGAVVSVELENGTRLLRRSRTDGSYVSAHDPRVLVGLGKSNKIRKIMVRWPDGTNEEFGPVPFNKYSNLVKGTGKRSDK